MFQQVCVILTCKFVHTLTLLKSALIHSGPPIIRPLVSVRPLSREAMFRCIMQFIITVFPPQQRPPISYGHFTLQKGWPYNRGPTVMIIMFPLLALFVSFLHVLHSHYMGEFSSMFMKNRCIQYNNGIYKQDYFGQVKPDFSLTVICKDRLASYIAPIYQIVDSQTCLKYHCA